jgi:hypothetical protein
MPTLTRWYERRAKDCVQSAGRADNLRHREHLLRLAYEWASAAQQQASRQSKPQRMDAAAWSPGRSVAVEVGGDRHVRGLSAPMPIRYQSGMSVTVTIVHSCR